MLIVDGTPLNLTSPSTKTEKWVEAEMDKLKSIKKIRFERNFKHNDVGYLLSPSNTYIQMTAIFRNNDGIDQQWMYTTKRPKYNGTEKIYDHDPLKAGISIDVEPKKNLEKAFMLYVIMPRILSSNGYVLKDYEKEAKALNAAAKAEAEVKYMVLTQLSDEDLKLHAYRYAIKDVEDKSIDVLKQNLINAVMQYDKDGRVSVSEFIKEINEASDNTVMSAYVNKAFDDGIIMFNKKKTQIVYEGGNTLCTIPPGRIGDPTAFIVGYLSREKDSKEAFLAQLEGNETISKIATIAGDYKNIRNVMKLKKYAKDRDVEFPDEVKTVTQMHEYLDGVLD